MKRGEIYWADIAPRSGNEQTGRRPVVIASRDSMNRVPAWASFIVVPLTTSEAQRRRGPTAVVLPAGVGSLSRPSTALCHQVTTLDRSKFVEYIGTMPTEWMRQIDAGLVYSLELDSDPLSGH